MILQADERQQTIPELSCRIEILLHREQTVQPGRQRGHDHRQPADPAVGADRQSLEGNHVDACKNGKIWATEEASVMNSRDLHVRPLDCVNNILFSKLANLFRCDLNTGKQGDVVHHDG